MGLPFNWRRGHVGSLAMTSLHPYSRESRSWIEDVPSYLGLEIDEIGNSSNKSLENSSFLATLEGESKCKLNHALHYFRRPVGGNVSGKTRNVKRDWTLAGSTFLFSYLASTTWLASQWLCRKQKNLLMLRIRLKLVFMHVSTLERLSFNFQRNAESSHQI